MSFALTRFTLLSPGRWRVVELSDMNLRESLRVVPRLEWRVASGSTNADLRVETEENPGAWPHLSSLVTDNQTAGRGRLNREWVAAPGTALAASVLIAPAGGLPSPGDAAWGWLPLLAGVAMVRAVREVIPDPRSVTLKWPNDVLIGDKKVCGILTELTPRGIIVGSGLNLSMSASQLPTTSATSLVLEGATTWDLDTVLAKYLRSLSDETTAWTRAFGATTDSIRDRVLAVCSTVGRRVRVELPDQEPVEGLATDIDASGRLVVETSHKYPQLVVAAGDVTHLRVLMAHDTSTGDGAHHAS